MYDYKYKYDHRKNMQIVRIGLLDYIFIGLLTKKITCTIKTASLKKKKTQFYFLFFVNHLVHFIDYFTHILTKSKTAYILKTTVKQTEVFFKMHEISDFKMCIYILDYQY